MSVFCPGVQQPVPCLVNTTGHCTWCGRVMPRGPGPGTAEQREFRRREYTGESVRDMGTDPLGYIDGDEDEG
jgi:hypothetical protein